MYELLCIYAALLCIIVFYILCVQIYLGKNIPYIYIKKIEIIETIGLFVKLRNGAIHFSCKRIVNVFMDFAKRIFILWNMYILYYTIIIMRKSIHTHI